MKTYNHSRAGLRGSKAWGTVVENLYNNKKIPEFLFSYNLIFFFLQNTAYRNFQYLLSYAGPDLEMLKVRICPQAHNFHGRIF